MDFLSNVWSKGYCKSDSIEVALFWTLVLGTICFILSKVTNEYSWVDRMWSILPIAYAFHFLYHQSYCRSQSISWRQIMMMLLTLVWGMRLSYNFYRKGGYQRGGQDYRWQYIRKNFNKIFVELLNFFFTSYLQLVIILWFSSPINFSKQTSFNFIDIVLIILWILCFLGESLADHQQYLFQKQKKNWLSRSNGNLQQIPYPYRDGFITDGLFRYSRHPNFFCEISMWWIIFFFSVNSVGLNLSGIGGLLLTLLFLGSTTLTEEISSGKYPAYIRYKKSTPMLFPRFGGNDARYT